MRPGPLAARPSTAEDRLERLERRLQRERRARQEVEEIAERTTRALYDKQQELRLLEAVVLATNESSTVEGALQGAVVAVCAHTSWPVGHVYAPDPFSADLVPTGIWHIDPADRSAALRRMTGQSTFDLGRALANRVLASGRPAWMTDEATDSDVALRDCGVRGAFAFPVHAEGEIRAILEFFTPGLVEPDPALIDVVEKIGRQVGRVVERIRAQAHIAHQATHDELTGLGNRVLLKDRLELALARAGRRGSLTALLFLDLDRFKEINDTLGHTAGDQLLRDVSRRLTASLRTSDLLARSEQELTLTRFGGDEFVLLCEELKSESDAVRIAHRVQQGLLSPFVLDDKDNVVTASIGIALAHGTHREAKDLPGDAEDLLRNADIAMYRAKESGPGRCQIFDERSRAEAVARIEIERALRRAVTAGELTLHYQPIVTLEDSRVRSVEALVRWEHPERGLLLPGEFIPIAEESALVVQIGNWTLREACKQAQRWRERFGDRAPLPVNVNVSARQLAEPELPDVVRQVLRETGASPGDLAIEVTETALIEDTGVPDRSLRELKALGIRILLDDFGTGYSSLSHLQKFPIDALKIDRSFVKHLSAQGDDLAIVSAIAAMASALGLDVVGEGVEQEEQADHLRELGCGWAQGYHFARPAPPSAIESLIGRGVLFGSSGSSSG